MELMTIETLAERGQNLLNILTNITSQEAKEFAAHMIGRAIKSNDASYMNSWMEKAVVVNKNYVGLIAKFALDNFPVVQKYELKSVNGKKVNCPVLAYSGKKHKENFAGLTAEDLTGNALTADFNAGAPEYKTPVRKTLAEKHAAALKTIQDAEQNVPELARARNEMFPPRQNMTVESILELIGKASESLTQAEMAKIMAMVESIVSMKIAA